MKSYVTSRKFASVGALMLGAALLCPARVSADPTDTEFAAVLAANGVSVGDPNTASTMAHAVCAGFDQGESASVLALKVMNDSNLSPKKAGFFVGASVSAYCPQYKSATGDPALPLVPPPL